MVEQERVLAGTVRRVAGEIGIAQAVDQPGLESGWAGRRVQYLEGALLPEDVQFIIAAEVHIGDPGLIIEVVECGCVVEGSLAHGLSIAACSIENMQVMDLG